MNEHIKKALGLASQHSALKATSYYAAYMYVPGLVAGPMIQKYGYRATASEYKPASIPSDIPTFDLAVLTF